MSKRSRKKVAGHKDLHPGEQVIDTCWGLGRGFLKAADVAGKMFLSKQISRKPKYAEELDAVTEGEGMASRMSHNGMLVLTDRRLLWMEAKTALGKPKRVNAEFALDDIEEIAYGKPILAVRFSDGSQGGIHTVDKPLEFVGAWQSSRPA